MPTIFTHAVLPLVFGLALGHKTVSPRLIAAGMVAAVLPDADVVGFAFGIPYEHALEPV
jgi:inner membrane protein